MSNSDELPGGRKIVVWTIGIIALLFVIGVVLEFAGGYVSLAYRKTFGVANANLDRQQYEQTLSYRKGNAQRLATLCGQVDNADEGHKPMIRDQIAHEFANVNSTDVPDYLRPCLAAARGQ